MLLRIVGALTTPTSPALMCRWRSRPQHHKRTKLLSQFAAQDMPTCSGSANLVKSCRYERLYVSHKAIAGGAWIDGIRFDHGSTTLLGVLHRCPRKSRRMKKQANDHTCSG